MQYNLEGPMHALYNNIILLSTSLLLAIHIDTFVLYQHAAFY